MRWYHWIAVYMMIGGAALWVMLPELFAEVPYVFIPLLVIILGYIGVKYLPSKKEAKTNY